MNYRVEWKYADLTEDGTPRYLRDELWLYFNGLIRFLDVPPGDGHCAFFGFSVLWPEAARAQGYVHEPKRGFLSFDPLSYAAIVASVENAITEAFAKCDSRAAALDRLDATLIFTGKDFSAEFAGDLLAPEEIVALIERAFDGVSRGEGTTLHQAIAIDDYASEEAVAEAKQYDTETRWQDVPDDVIAQSPSVLTFLDETGRRYYLPAYMRWTITNQYPRFSTAFFQHDPCDIAFYTWHAIVPTISDWDYGKGRGEAYDVDAYVRKHNFTPAQVEAIYRFLCFSAIEGGLRVSEEELPILRKWRAKASS